MPTTECFSLVLAGNAARNRVSLQKDLMGFTGAAPDGRFLFNSLGLFDQMVLSIGQSVDSLCKADLLVHASPHVDYHYSYYGRILHKKGVSAWPEVINANGICGFTSCRLTNSYRAAFADPEARDKIIIDALTQRLAHLDMSWALGAMIGWEDYSLLWFCRDFETMAKAVGVLRSLDLSCVPIEYKQGEVVLNNHWFSTTCSVPAVHVDLSRTTEPNKLARLYNVSSPLSWSVRLEIKPGHWSATHAMIQKLSGSCDSLNDLTYDKIFGQHDLRCADRGGTLGGLLNFLRNVVFPLTDADGGCILKTDTHLHIIPKAYNEGTADSFSIGKFNRSNAPSPNNLGEGRDELKALCSAAGIPRRSIEAILRTFRKIDNFAHHDLLRADFAQLHKLTGRFLQGLKISCERICRMNEDDGAHLDVPGEIRNLGDSVTTWLAEFERCLSDRFRGVYPMGDAVSMRIATYFSSQQKFLSICDYFGNASTDLFFSLVSDERSRYPDLQPVPKLDLVCISYLGCSPNIWCNMANLKDFGTSFIDIPSDSIFYAGEFVAIAHEIGHHATMAYLMSEGCFPMLDWDSEYALDKLMRESDNGLIIDKESVHYIKEILAELFALSLCSRGQMSIHVKLLQQLACRGYSAESESVTGDNGNYSKEIDFTLKLRASAARAIFAVVEKQILAGVCAQAYRHELQACYEKSHTRTHIISQFNSGDDVDSRHDAAACERVEAKIIKALNILDHVRCRPAFSCFLHAIVKLSKVDEYKKMGDRRLLGLFRSYAQTDSSGDLAPAFKKIEHAFNNLHSDVLSQS